MVNYQENSIKVTETGIQTNRRSIGFFPHEVSNVADFVLEMVGPEVFETFTKHFRDEIYNPRPDSLLMLGTDGEGFEFYAEFGHTIASYDAGKQVEFVYHLIPNNQTEFVYGYMERVLPGPIVQALNQVIPIDKCTHLWVKNSPAHRFVYLFKNDNGTPVCQVKDVLKIAARAINSDEIQLEDDLHVVIIGLAVTSDGKPQFSIYFRKLVSDATSGPSSEG